jgi:hypothetical protein
MYLLWDIFPEGYPRRKHLSQMRRIKPGCGENMCSIPKYATEKRVDWTRLVFGRSSVPI